MENKQKTYLDVLEEIIDSHASWANDVLDAKLQEYYKLVPTNITVSSKKLDKIIQNRFKEGTHWKKYTVKL